MNALATSTTLAVQALAGLPSFSLASRGPVVLLVDRGGARSAARQWAMTLADALQTELVEIDLTEAIQEFGEPWAARLDRTARLAQTLQPLAARVVVLPAGAGWPAESAGGLATQTGVPCLVARAPQAHRGVLAATSLEDRRHPVLQEAASIAHAMGRPLTVLHNATARIAGAGRGVRVSLEQRLDQVASELGAEAVVTRALDAVSGILSEARREDADLIVVGASTSPSNGGPVGGRITGMARRSVLVVPLSA